MALALLIAIWGVFLGVTLVRKRAEYRADSSIGAFQRQLQVLRRNSQAFDRAGGVAPSHSMSRDASLSGLASLHLRQVNRVDPMNRVDPIRSALPAPIDGAGGRAAGTAAQGELDPYFRPDACQRRRDVLMILVSALLSTGLISIIPAARMALVLTAIAAAALLIYLVLLVRLRAHATEREMKLRYMPAPIEAPVFADQRFIAR